MIGYGHLGDGNLHLNIMSNCESVACEIEPFVYEFTQQMKGSISAEHGLGFMKGEKIGAQGVKLSHDCLLSTQLLATAPMLRVCIVAGYSKSAEAIQVMADVKALLDPNRILNPYKVLPATSFRSVDERS